ELVQHVLDLRPHGRGPVNAREKGTPVGDAYRESEAGLEGLHDQLAVVPSLDSPVVPRGKLEIQHADPSSNTSHDSTAGATPTSTGVKLGRLVRLVLARALEGPQSLFTGLSCLALPFHRRLLVVLAPLHLLIEAILEICFLSCFRAASIWLSI